MHGCTKPAVCRRGKRGVAKVGASMHIRFVSEFLELCWHWCRDLLEWELWAQVPRLQGDLGDSGVSSHPSHVDGVDGMCLRACVAVSSDSAAHRSVHMSSTDPVGSRLSCRICC